jgi:hypothetical protein
LRGLRGRPAQYGKLRRGSAARAGVGPLTDRVLREARAVRKAAQGIWALRAKGIISDKLASSAEQSKDAAIDEREPQASQRAEPALLPIDLNAAGFNEGADQPLAAKPSQGVSLPGWDIALESLQGVRRDVQRAVSEVRRQASSPATMEEVDAVGIAANAAMAAFMEDGAGRPVID